MFFLLLSFLFFFFNDTATTEIYTLSLHDALPIYVNFSVPEQQLRAVRGYMSSGPLAVEALAPGSDQPAASGTLVFVDNAVDPSTGTIKLRAQKTSVPEAAG